MTLLLFPFSYPTNNCISSGTPIDPNTLLASTYLNHDSVKALSQPYLNTSSIAAQHGKPFIMFETNTASCGGFSGLSDSFVSALWMVDYALDMASSGFSNALLHVGGQSDYYNVSEELLQTTDRRAQTLIRYYSRSPQLQRINLPSVNGPLVTHSTLLWSSPKHSVPQAKPELQTLMSTQAARARTVHLVTPNLRPVTRSSRTARLRDSCSLITCRMRMASHRVITRRS